MSGTTKQKEHNMKLNRRTFFKKSIFAALSLPLIGKTTGLFQNAFSADKPSDSGIKKQGYVHDVAELEKMKTAKPADYKKYKKYVKAKTADFQPNCSNCTFYKKPEGEWGSCAMVGANKKPNKWVFQNGMCKVYNQNKKAKA
jgi:hypothetical protein